MKTELIVIGLIVTVLLALIATIPSDDAQVKKFSSHEELNNFVKASAGQYYGGFETFGAPLAQRALTESTQGEVSSTPSAPDYSTTNIQVKGVDEADIIKSDGKYLYIVSGQSLVIVDAFPAGGAKIVSQIELNRTLHEIFINGDKLVVFGSDFNQQVLEKPIEGPGIARSEIAIYPYYSSKAFIHVYDVSDRSNPMLKRDVSLDGNYFDSRMIGDYVYTIINQPFSLREGDVVPLPRIYQPEEETIAATDISYFNAPDVSYKFVTIISLNTQNSEVSKDVYMMGSSENIYVSQNNIYITYMKRLPRIYYTERLIEQVLIPLVPGNVANEIRAVLQDGPEMMNKVEIIVSEYFNKLSQAEKAELEKSMQEKTEEYYIELAKETQKTVVHKIAISDGNVEYKTRGEVPGRVLNQFSMDEYNGNFRIATTTTNFNQFGVATRTAVIQESVEGSEATIAIEEPLQPVEEPARPPRSLNHVYVLDENMDIIGKLENLAPDERIYSARFMGDRLYLVTFVQIDPLFVIDLSNPTDPKVLGELKIPGVSQYLHPYDENHIIGVGKEATGTDEGGRQFALFQGVKIALFDVSDVSDPKEISKYVIGDRGTDSEVLRDHKAFLFNKEKNLLVLPIRLHEIESKQNDWQYGDYKFSGAFVFHLDLEDGFVLEGIVKHHESTGRYYESAVRRSMYIGDVLYTLSNKLLKMNDLDDLAEINEIELPSDNGFGIIKPVSVVTEVVG